MLPRRSSSVCSLMAALVERNGAQGNTDRHRSMVRGIQRIDRVFQIDAERFSSAYRRRAMRDQRLGKVGVDAPVAHLVGIGQRRATNTASSKSHVVELAGLRRKHASMSRKLSR